MKGSSIFFIFWIYFLFVLTNVTHVGSVITSKVRGRYIKNISQLIIADIFQVYLYDLEQKPSVKACQIG